MDYSFLQQLSLRSLLDLSTDLGINASGKEDVYGCIFGRDSALTILKILRAHSRQDYTELLQISRLGLITLSHLQGSEFNYESGEEPGKFIHEFRQDKGQIKRLLSFERPWFVYPDGILRNYDSLDSTPLALIAMYKYWQASGDGEFLVSVLPAIEAGLNWLISFGDMDKDLLLEYDTPLNRVHGGLLVQSWTDSHESLLNSKGQMPKYPIAPVEVQGYCWLALKLWADHYADGFPEFSKKLSSQAEKLKGVFNSRFILKNNGLHFAPQALDGDKKQIKTVTGNPLLLLWASYKSRNGLECILDESIILDFVKRGFKKDLFDPDAGIRTMSTTSKTFNPRVDSYHNGSFWPILNGLIFEGLKEWGFTRQAEALKIASLKPLLYFKTPIELYSKDESGEYLPYLSPSGQTSCKYQAWTAAATLDFVTD